MRSVEILIADDHEVFRRTLRGLVESRSDWRVCGEAGDGIEAIEKVRELRPDIVLMDINMPRMDGLEATRIIRRDIPGSKVIIVTQNHASIAREQARSVHAEGSITKSDLAQDLFPAIEKVFGEAKSAARAESPEEDAHPEEWVRAGGALGRLVHDFDWAKTPLGPMQGWPRNLTTVVRVMLASRFAMWMSWGPELTFLYNDAYAKMTLGKKHPWALGKPSQKVWEEIWGDISPRIQKVMESGQATWDEGLLLFLERSGYREETYHTFSYSPLLGDDGRVAGHLCVVTEETDRVIGDRRLKTLRSLAAELSKTITEEDVVASVSRILGDNQQDLPFSLLYLVSPDGKQARLACRTGMAAGHPAAPEVIELDETHLKWPLPELFGGKDSVLVEDLALRFNSVPAGAWNKSPNRALLLPIASQTQVTPAGVLIAGLNPYRPVDVSYAGFFNLLAGQIAASIANAHAYEEERKRNEALAELDRAKTEFFSNVSHEFRTPLTLMLAPLEDTLAGRDRLPAEDRQRLEVAHRNSLRLLKLVNTLLDFSRIEAGRLDASYEPTDLCQLTSELASVFRSAIERAGLRFTIDCPSIADPVYVDREMWEKIVFNLLSNALKFTFKGEIGVSIQKGGERVELAVTDTGTGIPESDLPHLFERFYRVKGSHGRTLEGTGIGLALVQQLVKLHGGTVRVQSEWGRGSTFTLSIPLGKDHLPPDRIGAVRTLRSTGIRGEAYVEQALHWLPGNAEVSDDVQNEPLFSAFQSIPAAEKETAKAARILLADDNADMRNYVERLLRRQYEVVAVADGQAALEFARQHPPDLILTDVMMPRLDGFGLLQRLRADPSLREIPVILLSARAGEESRIEGLGAGADDYLVKPFSARELLARVASHLTMATMRREAAEVERRLHAAAELERGRLRELFMQAPAGIALLTGPEHRFTFVNLEYVRATGRQKVEDFVGRTLREAFPDLEGQGFFARIDGVYRTGVPYTGSACKMLLKRAANAPLEEVYFDFIYQPMRDLAGKVEGILVHAVDVTQQVSARQEIERREQHFRQMIDSLPAAIYTTDAAGRLTHFNHAAVAFSGRTPQLGTDQWCVSWKLFHPDGRPMPHDECPMAVALKEGRVIEGEEAIAERPDGTRRWFMPFPTPLRDRAGKIVGGINMLLDITERKEAERTNSLLAAIVDSSDDAIISKNLDGVITTWNKSAERTFGYTAEEAIGQHITLLIPEDHWEEEADILSRLRRGQRIDHFETIRKRKDGTLLEVALTISPIRDSAGRVIGASKVARDITEKKRAERNLATGTRQQKALFEFADALHRAVTLDEVYSATFAAIFTALRCDRASILLCDEAGVMRFMSWRGLSKCYRAAVEGHSPWSPDEKNPQPVCISDIDSAEISDALKATVKTEGIAALAFIPLLSGDQLIGKFMTYFDSPHTFAGNELDLSLAIARQLAFAIDRKHNDEALKHSEQRFRTLSESLDAEVRARTRELEERNADVLRQSHQLRELSWRLLLAQDEERRHFARELHDSAGQTLTVLGLNLAQIVQKAGQNSPELVNEIESIQEMVQQLHREIRTTSYLLHPPLLDESGLYSAISWYVEGLLERSGIDIRLDVAKDFGRLPRDMELVVFRMVQECLTNIHRHAESKTASIRMARDSDQITLDIRDQGKGMSAERLAEIQAGRSGVGIGGMRERLRQFDGTLNIESDDSGTRVLATIPVPKVASVERQDKALPLQAAV